MIKRPKVLIVEDNLMHQKVIVHILNKYFTKDVITTANPKEAFPILRTNKPDFLIMDIEMPLMNGVEMLELIRNMEGLEDLKVIAYSAKLEKEIIFLVDLPPLLFDAATRTSWLEFKTNFIQISTLGISLVS